MTPTRRSENVEARWQIKPMAAAVGEPGSVDFKPSIEHDVDSCHLLAGLRPCSPGPVIEDLDSCTP